MPVTLPPSADGPIEFSLPGSPLNLLAAAQESEAPQRFEIVAYAGGLMRLPNYPLPVVVDIRGVTAGDGRRPVLVDHNNKIEANVGHSDEIALSEQIVVRGPFSGGNASTEEVISKLRRGAPLEASVGMVVPPGALQKIEANQTVRVNGKVFRGPLLVATKAELKEVSITPVGASNDTSVRLAASAYSLSQGGDSMPKDSGFNQWCADRGISPDSLDATQVEKLEATYQADQQATNKQDKTPAKEAGGLKIEAASDGASELGDLEGFRQKLAAETARAGEIRNLCAKYGNPEVEVNGDKVDLASHAIQAGWDNDSVELAAIKSKPTQLPFVRVSKKDQTSPGVIEAAFASQLIRDEKFLISKYGEKTLEASQAPGMRDFSLGKLMHHCIVEAGGYVHPGARGDELARAYKEHVLRASGFSTVSLPGILGNVAHKSAEQAFRAQDVTYPRATSSRSVSNFQTHTSYRLTSAMKYEKVGKDGELKSGKLHEESYTNKIDTYGGTFTLTRQDIINDDLGLFGTLPSQVGSEAAQTVEEAVYTLLKGLTSSFFASGKGNLKTSNAFSAAGVVEAEKLFMLQTKLDGRPIALQPYAVLVPVALKYVAEQLFGSPDFNETTTANTPKPSRNILAGRYQVIPTPYLDLAPSGSSSTWWLIANPAVESMVEVAYLNGRSAPTIESEDAPFDVLGTAWRYYFDFGVASKEYRAGVKCTA